MKLFLLIVLFLGSVIHAAPQEITVPFVEERWVKSDILTNQNSTPWDFAAVCHSFLKLGSTRDADRNTQARIWHDGTKLYFGFFRSVTDKSVCNNSERDSDVWADDSVALYIVPDPAVPTHFYQIDINANGIIYDAENYGLKEDKSKDFPSLQANVFKGIRGWLLYASVTLTDLNLRPGQKILLNFSSHRREPSENEYSTFAPLSKVSFQRPEEFIPALLAPDRLQKGQLYSYSFSENPELILDGESEFGTNERWTRGKNAWPSHWYRGSGIRAIAMICKAPENEAHYFHPLFLEPRQRYMVSFLARYSSLETPNMIPAQIHCYNKDRKKIAVLDGPSLGNAGGGAPNNRFDAFGKDFTAPEGTASAELELRMVCSGELRIDAVSVRKYVAKNFIPQPKFPKDQTVLHTTEILFQWELFSKAEIRPGTITLQVSRNSDFPKEETMTFSECAYMPGGPGWLESLPGNGTYFWRCRFDGEGGGAFSKASQFTINCTPENEKISPVIQRLSPRGAMAQRESAYAISFYDPGISSGIGKITLRLNRTDVTASATIDKQKITFQLPNDTCSFYEVECIVTDNNGNKDELHDFIAIVSDTPTVHVDSQGFLVKNGKRFFPIATYAYMEPESFAKMPEYGYNSNWGPFASPSSPILWHLAADATRAGIGTFPFLLPDFMAARGYIPYDCRAARRAQEKALKDAARLAGHPGILAFYVGDESIDGGYRMDIHQRFYKDLKKAVPELPVVWLPTYGQSNRSAWTDAPTACDILVHDDYVIQKGRHLDMIRDMDRIIEWSGKNTFIECIGAHAPTGEWEQTKQNLPTYEDLRFVIWASITTGARGIIIYVQPIHRTLTRNPYVDSGAPDFPQRLQKILLELEELLPFLISDQIPEDRTKVLSGQVRILEKVWNGQVLTMAVNIGNEAARIAYPDETEESLPHLGVALKVRNL